MAETMLDTRIEEIGVECQVLVLHFGIPKFECSIFEIIDGRESWIQVQVHIDNSGKTGKLPGILDERPNTSGSLLSPFTRRTGKP
jgi:hypothetical protein